MSPIETAAEPAATTLGQALARAARDPAAGVRLLDRRERVEWLPWSGVLARARGVAGGLIERGVERGDRVALVARTGRELIEGFFGVSLAGAVPACLPPPPRLASLDGFVRATDAMLAAAGVRMVLTERRAARRLRELLGPQPLGTWAPDELDRVSPAAAELPASDGLAMIQFTSGTASVPKPVALSHRAVLGQARLLNSFWPARGGGRDLGCSWLPLHHDMGLIGCLFTALERPGELVLMPPEVFAARPAIWLRAISRHGATISPATNFAYAHCVEMVRDEELAGVDLSTWRVALNGAEPVSAEVMRRFSRRFSRWGFRAEALTPVYGLAEAALAVTFSEVERPFVSARFASSSLDPGEEVMEDTQGRELVSVGRPLPGFDVAIRDATDSEMPQGVVGRIWTRGPTLMDGYLGADTATGEVLRGGWLDTGDLGFVRDGELFVTGRVKDVIIVRGRNHSAVEIEQAVETVAGVAVGGAAAVGHLSETADREEVLLFVERAKGIAEDRLAEACRTAVLEGTGIELDHLELLPPGAIPRTSSGKVRRAELLRRHLDRRARAS